MKTVNIHEAKTNLSRLIDSAAKGEPFIIAKAGKPLVKVVPLEAQAAPRRLAQLESEHLEQMCQVWAANWAWLIHALTSASILLNARLSGASTARRFGSAAASPGRRTRL